MSNYFSMIKQWLLFAFIYPLMLNANVNGEYSFQHLTTEHGLSQSYIFSIYQDSKGYMWFGTWDGLNKYDGYQFTVFKPDPYNPNSLSNNCVTAIYEDRYGIIWIGTNGGGLNRLLHATVDPPGTPREANNRKTNFMHFKNITKDTSCITGDNITAIIEDDFGNIWVGTYENGINIIFRDSNKIKSCVNYRKEFKSIGSISDNHITCLFRDNEGTIWVGSQNGLMRSQPTKRPQDQFFYTYLNDPENENSISGNYITAILEDHLDQLWIGTDRNGLNKMISSKKMHSNRAAFIKYSPNSNSINTLCLDRNNKMWIGTINGISILNPEFFSTNKNVQFIHIESNPDDPNSLLGNHVETIYEDRFGVLWVGTFKGINKRDLIKKEFQIIDNSYHQNLIIPDQNITSVLQDKENNFWIGSESGILTRYLAKQNKTINYLLANGRMLKIDVKIPEYDNTSQRRLTPTPKFSNNLFSGNFINSIVCDNQNNIWIGGVGLYKFNIDNQQFKYYRPGRHDGKGLSGWAVWDIHPDDKENLWIATSDGLNIFNKKKKQFIVVKHDPDDTTSLSNNKIWDITEDIAGNIWIGTDNGLNCLQHEYISDNQIEQSKLNFTRFMHNPRNIQSISSNKIWVIHEANDKLYIGTEGGGLNVMEVGKSIKNIDEITPSFKNYREPDGLAGNIICGILSDQKGNLWISTTNGLSKFNPENETFKNFTKKDGLQGNEFNKGAYYQSHDHKMFFGGINGLNAFYPDSIKNNPFPPQVQITGLKIFDKHVPVGSFKDNRVILNKPISETKKIELGYKDDVLTFKFVALHYLEPTNNKYAYKMNGFEENWNYTDYIDREATYTNLPPGNYSFLVKASNSDGVWSQSTSLEIKISPPYWANWWAYIIYIIVGGGLLYSIFIYIISKERLKSNLQVAMLEAKQKDEITQKNDEIHNMKLKFFTNVSHEFKTPLTLILGPLENLRNSIVRKPERQQLNFVYRNAQNLLLLVNQLMDFRKLETSSIEVKARLTNVNIFTRRIISAFHYLAKEQNIKLSVKNMVNDIHCWFDRDMMEKVLNNLLSNAFKFVSQEGEINVIIDQYSNNDEQIKSTFKNYEKYEEGFVSIEVVDTGKGMSEEQLARVFDRFYQGDDDDNNKYYGSGIGLALTKQLVDIHKGEIIVKSKPGKGSSFNVLLPLGKDHFKEKQLIEETCPSEPVYNKYQSLFETVLMEDIDEKEKELINNEKAPLILIVEDNDDLRLYIRTCLNDQYCIIEANNGLEGREKALEEIPDLIITDIMMPDLDGYELSSQLKNNEKTSHIPIIMLTALSSEDERIKGYEKGADEYISKPFTTSVLQARIKNIIESREKLKKRYSNSIISESDEEMIEQTDRSFMDKVIALVEKNISNSSLGVDEFANELHLSRTQLYRKIKGLTGQGVTEFIRSIKLKKALEMMKKDDYTINEIAYKTGFNSQSYFTRCFKEIYGKSPLEYLEELNKFGK